MMVCPQCGKRYPPDIEFCEEDGHLLATLADDPYIGYQLGHFRLEKRIGRGGFGVVYLASHVELDNTVAIKILRKQFITDEQLVERFKREARVSSQLRHENVVQILDFGYDHTIGFYYAMEYLDGISLSQLMKDYPKGLPLERLLPILEQICFALDLAHGRNVVHRDLKPSNIFLVERFSKNDVVKILDFGIAKVLQDEEGKGVTATGQIVGSPRFMSPEQARGRHTEVDPRSDIYALGVMLFWMLTGRLPFESKQLARLLFMHIKTPPPTLNSIRMAPHFTPELEAVIASALAKEKIERPNSAGELYSRVVYACSQQIPDAHRALLEDFEEDRTVRVDKSMIRDVIWKQTAHKTSGEPTDTPSGISYLQTALNTDSSTAYLNNNPSLSHAQTEEDDELGHTKLDNFHNYLADADSPPAFVIPDVRSFPITTPAQASYPPPPPLGLALPLLKDEEPTTLNPSTQTDRKHTTNQNYRSTDSPRPLSSPPIDILDARFHNPKNDSTQPQNTLPFQSQPKSNKRRWKTILLLILTLVLLGELLFVGWRLWQKYKTKPQPTPTSQNYHLQTNRHYDCSIDIKNNTQLTTAQIQHSRIQPIIAVLCNNGSLYALNLPSYPAQNHALIKNSASKHTVLG